jgi:hypothetical protein
VIRILEALVRFFELLEKAGKKITIKRVKDAKDEMHSSDDQRELEASVGGNTGPSKRNHPGMYTRPRKDRSGSLED